MNTETKRAWTPAEHEQAIVDRDEAEMIRLLGGFKAGVNAAIKTALDAGLQAYDLAALLRSMPVLAEDTVHVEPIRLPDGDEGPDDFQIRALACERWAEDGKLDIDDTAKVSMGTDEANGAFVQAWVWVDFAGTDLDKS